jgi:hypothetical protein
MPATFKQECCQVTQFMLPAVSAQNPVSATAMRPATTPPARPPPMMRSRPLTQRPAKTAARQAAEQPSPGSRQTATRRAATLVRRAAHLPACQSPGEGHFAMSIWAHAVSMPPSRSFHVGSLPPPSAASLAHGADPWRRAFWILQKSIAVTAYLATLQGRGRAGGPCSGGAAGGLPAGDGPSGGGGRAGGGAAAAAGRRAGARGRSCAGQL